MKHALAVAAAVVLAMPLAACSSSDSTPEANEAYCGTLDALSAEIAELTSLAQGNATVAELQAQRIAISQSAEDVAAAADDVDEAIAAEMSGAEEAFEDAIDAIPSDATLEEAASAYTAAAQDYNDALRTEFQQLGCE